MRQESYKVKGVESGAEAEAEAKERGQWFGVQKIRYSKVSLYVEENSYLSEARGA